VVTRITKGAAFVRLDSGLEGTILGSEGVDLDQRLAKGKAVTATVTDLAINELKCVLSLTEQPRPEREYQPDSHWDHNRFERDQEMVARKKKAEVNRSRRVIKHPNFHNFNSSQAEAYLEQQQRGDVVIRPSSKGQDHLAVTWKVDTGLYQHIGKSIAFLCYLA
jgi:transcription elongation factor SPT6